MDDFKIGDRVMIRPEAAIVPWMQEYRRMLGFVYRVTGAREATLLGPWDEEANNAPRPRQWLDLKLARPSVAAALLNAKTEIDNVASSRFRRVDGAWGDAVVTATKAMERLFSFDPDAGTTLKAGDVLTAAALDRAKNQLIDRLLTTPPSLSEFKNCWSDKTPYGGSNGGPEAQRAAEKKMAHAAAYAEGPRTLAAALDATSGDPKRVAGSRKPGTWNVPDVATFHMAQAMDDGARKYGRFNWRRGSGVNLSVYINAMQRHLSAFKEGEDFARDSGVHHLAHLMASAAILLDAGAHGKLIDDRGPPSRALTDFLTAHTKKD